MLGRPDRTVVVVESAGRCHAATAAGRAAAGSTPVRLDPFGVLGGPADQFNPLDLLRHPHEAPLADAFTMAEIIMRYGSPSIDLVLEQPRPPP